ncbi:MAG: serine hydrolase, partial [Bacteroidota bacterium]
YKGQLLNTQDFLAGSTTTGLLVLQNDSIRFEQYYQGNTPSTANISWSMAKSFISALVGIAVEEGHIQHVLLPIEHYVPELKGTAYEGVRIKDILQMSSGVKFDEDYEDFYSDINRWGRGFALGSSQDDFAATLERERPAGTYNHYVSINTHVLGMLVARATGRTVTKYMQEKFWNPVGMEHGGYWVTDDEGVEVALGGLNTSLRNFAKIGSVYLNQGQWRGKQIVPAAWVKVSLTPDAPHLMPGDNPNSTRTYGYGYQWWLPQSTQGEFMAQGVYNQNIYVNPTTRTVIVKLSANARYNDPTYLPSRTSTALALYRRVAQDLALK